MARVSKRKPLGRRTEDDANGARVDRNTTETKIALKLDHRRPGPLQREYGHPLFRSHAGACSPGMARSISI